MKIKGNEDKRDWNILVPLFLTLFLIGVIVWALTSTDALAIMCATLTATGKGP